MNSARLCTALQPRVIDFYCRTYCEHVCSSQGILRFGFMEIHGISTSFQRGEMVKISSWTSSQWCWDIEDLKPKCNSAETPAMQVSFLLKQDKAHLWNFHFWGHKFYASIQVSGWQAGLGETGFGTSFPISCKYCQCKMWFKGSFWQSIPRGPDSLSLLWDPKQTRETHACQDEQGKCIKLSQPSSVLLAKKRQRPAIYDCHVRTTCNVKDSDMTMRASGLRDYGIQIVLPIPPFPFAESIVSCFRFCLSFCFLTPFVATLMTGEPTLMFTLWVWLKQACMHRWNQISKEHITNRGD